MQLFKKLKTLILFSLYPIILLPFNNFGLAVTHPESEVLDTLERVSMIFEVKYGGENTLDVNMHPVIRRADQKFTYSHENNLPEGLNFSTDGILKWESSIPQLKALQETPFQLKFSAISQAGNVVFGQVRVYVSGPVPDETPVENAVSEDTPPAVTEVDSDTQPIVAPVVQEPKLEPLTIFYEKPTGWDSGKEGEAIEISFEARGGSGSYQFELLEPDFLMENLDRYGQFAWTPDFDFVSTRDQIKTAMLKIKVFDSEGTEIYENIPLYIENVNRPPIVNDLPPFYIQYGKDNTYQLNRKGIAYDPDGDSLIFKPQVGELPQGMTINQDGRVSWNPSRRQLNYLHDNPVYFSFSVEDYPAGEKVFGQVKMEVSQADLPPEITMIPNKQQFEIKEDDELHISFFITDPNGDSDLLTFSFVTENRNITSDALKDKGNWQFEFSWTPGFDFIEEEGQKQQFDISFFAIDKESNRTEKNILVTVTDTENILEKDRILYDQYRSVLAQCYDLFSQLNEKEKELEKKYKAAKKGKKNRSITTASLGALTGLSPVIFLENPDGQKIAAGVGGTATATIGTLEASNVIGEPPTDIMRDLNYVSQKRNDILIHGNIFASKYALPVSKRDKVFQSDMRSLSFQLNLQDIAKLELDATWDNPKKATARNIKRVFKDFNQDPRFESNYE